MKKLVYSVLATGSLALFIGVSDAEASSYTIKPGDTLWKIASSNNVSVANIKQWNNLNSDVIHPNQTLRLASAAATSTVQRTSTTVTPAPQAATSNVATYTVKAGDTLSKIAQLHRTTVSSIQQLNGITGHIIHPGQKLRVSGSAPAVSAPAPAPVQATATPAASPATSSTYKVVSGDTLSAISHRNGVSVTQLMNWNNLTSSLIRVGQVLKIENATVAAQPNVKPVSAPAPVIASNSSTVNKLISTATSLTGTPYVWGGSTTRGFDCSGYIYYVFNQAGIKIPRTNTNGYDARSYEVSNPQVGDLVFFSNTYKPGISHMGIYIGDNKFIHAGGDRVQVTSLNDSYWGKKFDSFKRFYAQ